MQKAYFISDVHLGLEEPQREKAKEKRLLEFLEKVRDDGGQLFIVGDLFDAWIEYRTVVPKGSHRVLTKLESLTESGVQVHYLAGNHDFWMRDHFRELGMKIHRDAFEITVNGKRVYIHHGDGLAANDAGYRILKKILRNRAAIWLYGWIHPDIGIKIARSSSKQSRSYTSAKDYGERDDMRTFAARKISEGCDIVVMGHRHQPCELQIGRGKYINLGDWITHNTFAEMNGGEIALRQWADERHPQEA